MTDHATDDTVPPLADVPPALDEAPDETPAPRSRRSFLGVAAAALGAVAAQTVASALPADAATGSTVKAGLTSTATSTTTVKATKAGTTALRGWASNTTESAASVGVAGQSDAPKGTGIKGVGSNGTGVGVVGDGGNVGIQGSARVSNGIGVSGVADVGVSAAGVEGRSATGFGVRGSSAARYGIGVYGELTAADGSAITGWTTADRSIGVVGRSFKSTGVRGESSANSAAGVSGTNTTATLGVGVAGRGNASNGYGVQGFGSVGTYGESTATGGVGVSGYASGTGGEGVRGVGKYGVRGETSTYQGFGVSGWTSGDGVGVYGWRDTVGYAGYFDGEVHVSGTLSKSAGSFVIDHPLDPENRYLAHSFVESPEMLNVYSGTVTLGAKGRATVKLPRYFEALNMEHRYQLTAIGAPAPELHVAEKIKGNRFVIAGGAPGLEVCWQVTGVRQDAYAQRHRIKVDTPKKAKDKGKYLNPDAFGKRRTDAIGYRKPPKARRSKKG